MSPLGPKKNASEFFSAIGPASERDVQATITSSTDFDGAVASSSSNVNVEAHTRILFGPSSTGTGQGRTGSNHVSTTKYELWNIVPKNLFEQFHRAANLWFLIVSIFQMLPLELSPTSKYATIAPLCCVLFVTFCKDAYEDYGRRRDDSCVNNRRCKVVDATGVRSSTPLETRWKDVNVGTYVQLHNNEPIPADMVVLACAGEEGVAYVDTAQLDGETSLKPKFALQETMRITTSKELLGLEGHVDAEPPNQPVGSFNGTLFLRDFPRGVPLDVKNFLLRGSTLRNTAWVFGLVVYTGYDTKLVQNLKKTPSKRSRVEVTANYLLLIVFGLLVAAALLSAVARAIFLRNGTDGEKNMSWVWPETDPLRDNQYLAFITFMIGYNNLIPISLYVTCDLVRAFQAFMMERDHSMYHAETDSGCRVRNSGLNENLGQVEFVLTDKTGTLTENHMQFKACSIEGRFYGNWDEERGSTDEIASMPPPHICMPLDGAPLQKMLQDKDHSASSSPKMDADEENIIDQFFLCLATCHTAMVESAGRKGEEPQSGSFRTSALRPPQALRSAGQHARKGEKREPNKASEATSDPSQRFGDEEEASFDAAPAYSICRRQQQQQRATGAPEGKNDVPKEATEVRFRSPSPDEEALVSAARDYGFFFRKKVANGITVNVRGKDLFFTVLIVNEFTSDRKRMSVLVRQCDSLPTVPHHNGPCCPYETSPSSCVMAPGKRSLDPLSEAQELGCRGCGDGSFAPSRYPTVLYVKGADNVMLERLPKNDQDIGVVKKHLKDFSKQGLRTLVVAKRELTDNQAHDFMQKMQEAEMAFMNRNALKERVADELERDFQILGVTAIEDQIQQGVPETVNMMLRAGVKVWMLTGDNMETAVNIGLACKLIDPTMQQYKLEPGAGSLADVNPTNVLDLLEKFYHHISRQLKAEREVGEYKYCLVLHGKVLYTILEEGQAKLRQLFLAIACSSASVIACRLAPAQKAALVKLVRNSVVGSPLTLAIGDGGNDVSMIQEAHVGVGVLGVEGRQAANAADYVIGQFRFLQQMLFVHGRWNLRRISVVIGYSFYKNFLLVLPLAFYAHYTGFTGTTLYESYLLTSFNLVFTSLPVLIVGVLDIDVSAQMALLVPSLYQMGIERRYFNARTLIGWIIRGFFHALLTFMIMMAIFSGSVADTTVPGGHMSDYLVMGSWAYWACITVANLTMMLHTKAWMDWQVFMVFGSWLIFLPSLFFYSDGDFIMARSLKPDMVGVASCLFGHFRSWAGLLLVTAACALSDLAVTFAKKEMAPNAADILQEVQLGRVAGIECPADATKEERQALARDYLSKIPPPPRKVMKLKPEDSVSLKPFPSPARKNGRKKAGRTHHSVVPVDENDEPESDRPLEDEPSIIMVPRTRWERFVGGIKETVQRIWQMRWTEMTLGELCGSVTCEQIEVSSHFQNAIRIRQGALRIHHLSANIPVNGDRSGSRGSRVQDLGTSLSLDSTPTKTLWKRIPRNSMTSDTAGSGGGDEVVESDNEDSKEVIKDLMYSAVSLRFKSHTQEACFMYYLCTQGVPLFAKSLLAFFIGLVLYNVYRLIIKPGDSTLTRVSVCVGLVLCGALAQLFRRPGNIWRHAEMLITLLVVCLIVLKHVYDYMVSSDGLLMNSYLPLLILAGTRIRFTFLLKIFLFNLLTLAVRYWCLAGTFVVRRESGALEPGQAPAAEYLILMVGICTLSSYYCYELEKLTRKDFFVLDSMKRSKYLAMEILKGMFPEKVVDLVLQQIQQFEAECQDAPPGAVPHKLKMHRALREDRGIVTILFCDICDFDGLAEFIPPVELVQLLDLLWVIFDRTCKLNGIMKIETVGKTYMAAALPEEPTDDPARHARDAANVVCAANGMLYPVNGGRFTGTSTVMNVSVQIGVHTGPAISGVMGSQKPQFALFGDTVNTASRMQSTGRRNLLHISGATHDALQGDPRFIWEPRQTQVKGKGIMTTYFLKRCDWSCFGWQDHHRMMPVGISQAVQDIAPPEVPLHNIDPSYMQSPMLPGIPSSSASENHHGVVYSHPLMDMPVPGGPLCLSDAESEAGDDCCRPGVPNANGGIFEGNTTPGTYTFDDLKGLDNSDCDDSEEEAPRAALAEQATGGQRCQWVKSVLKKGEQLLKDGDSPRMRGPSMLSQWVSFVAYLVTITAESIVSVTFGRASQEEERLPFILLVRFGYIAVSVLGAVVLFIVARRLKWGTKNRKNSLAFPSAIAGFVFIGFVCFFTMNMQSSAHQDVGDGSWTVDEGFFFVMVLIHLCRLHPLGVVPLLLCIIAVVAILMWVAMRDKELLLECLAYTVFIFGTHVVAVLGDPCWDLADHKAAYEDNERANRLLDSMLPPEVLAEMKVGHLSLAYQYEDMSFLFADIVGFTRYCSEHTAEQAVNLVTRLFAEFDQRAVSLGLYKVCTIGDAYVAVNEPLMEVQDKFGNCENVFKLGKHALQTIAKVCVEIQHRDLNMRIGIHFGKFVGGVIGTQCLRFDVWGEDVLIGNRVESNGRAGMICVSEAAKEVLQHTSLTNLTFSFHDDIKLKNDKVIRTYVCKQMPV